MARGKNEGGKVSKAAAYRDAAAKLGDKAELEAVHSYILEQHGIDMPKPQISQYRSNEKNRVRKGKRGRRSKAESTAVLTKPVRGDALIEYISTVKSWENKLGAEKICEVIGVLLKGR